MSLILSIFLGLKGLAILVGTMISTGGEGNVSLEISSMEIKRDTAWIDVKVKGIYSSELNDFLESGTMIPLHLEALLKSDKETVSHRTYTNVLRYELAEKHFLLVKSGDTTTIKKKDDAKDQFPSFKVPLFSSDDLQAGNFYQIKISCRLGKVELDILDMKEFDLMSLWNFKAPSLETKRFKKKDLVAPE
jgi:hypothetical protein